MKRTPSDALLIARAPRYNVDDVVAHSESPPVFNGPPPVFQPPHSKFGALGSVTANDCRGGSSVQGRVDTVDGGVKKVFSFFGYVGTPNVATPRDDLAHGLGSHFSAAHGGTEHHTQHLENGVDAILPAHYNECTKALTTGSHAILDRAGMSSGSSGSSGIGTATPSPSSSPPPPSSSPMPPSHIVGPRLGVEARAASQSHGSLLDIATSLFHRPQHRLHEQQPAAARGDPVARLGLEHRGRLTSRGSEPNFMSSRLVGSTGAGKTSLRYKQPMVSGQDLNALAPLDL